MCPAGEVVGGYKVLGEGLASPKGETRWRVHCLGCGGTCVRLARDVLKNKLGCGRCRTRICAAQAGARGARKGNRKRYG